jgi:hypothetical protein
LIFSAMAKDPAARPQSMEEMEQRLLDIAARCLPPLTADRLAGVSETPRPELLLGAGHGGAAVWDRLRGDRRRVAAVAATAFVAVALTIVGISRTRLQPRSARETSSVPSAAAAASPSIAAGSNPVGGGETKAGPAGPAVASSGPSLESPAPAENTLGANHLGADGSDATSRGAPGAAKLHPGGPAAPVLSFAETRKLLDDADVLMQAQRFNEASVIYTKLAKNRATRARALVALAGIAFQQKNYEETIRSAKLAAERGGGARAQVLLGDAHFRLSHYPAAVMAYEQALRLEPGNPSAKSGLALASKRM